MVERSATGEIAGWRERLCPNHMHAITFQSPREQTSPTFSAAC
jgi:hypothetical protein